MAFSAACASFVASIRCPVSSCCFACPISSFAGCSWSLRCFSCSSCCCSVAVFLSSFCATFIWMFSSSLRNSCIRCSSFGMLSLSSFTRWIFLSLLSSCFCCCSDCFASLLFACSCSWRYFSFSVSA